MRTHFFFSTTTTNSLYISIPNNFCLPDFVSSPPLPRLSPHFPLWTIPSSSLPEKMPVFLVSFETKLQRKYSAIFSYHLNVPCSIKQSIILIFCDRPEVCFLSFRVSVIPAKMILLQTKNKFGLFLAALAIALLILTVFYAANLDGDHQSNNVLNALCASTLLSAMTAISNLTPSFIPRGEERSHLQ